ncbi:MAG: hypothetical protein COA50_03805 [Flavobacteriaceae bacterium]|nr:MAG: hypothetical protein COA50_03805 [Flavobacteriaceae bacterium]
MISDIVLFIIVIQSILFAFVLFTHKGPKQISNRLLAVFLLVIGAQFSTLLMLSFNIYPKVFQPIMCVFGLAYGPLFYLYTLSVLYAYFDLKGKHFWHFAPALMFLLAALMGYSVCGTLGHLLYPSLLIYLMLSMLKIKEFTRIVKSTQSMNRKTDLKWLQWTLVIFSFAFFFDIINQFILEISIFSDAPITHFIILFLILWMFYKGLKQPHIFIGVSPSDALLVTKNQPPMEEAVEEVQPELDHIKKFLETEKPFTNADLSLNQLADALDMPARRLSTLINQYFQMNFMSFINDHRIAMAKNRLQNPIDASETILEVMYAVGFNSKSSFYTLFKKKTGLTPTQFKKEHSK